MMMMMTLTMTMTMIMMIIMMPRGEGEDDCEIMAEWQHMTNSWRCWWWRQGGMISQVGSGWNTTHIEYGVYRQIEFVALDFLSLFDKGTSFDHSHPFLPGFKHESFLPSRTCGAYWFWNMLDSECRILVVHPSLVDPMTDGQWSGDKSNARKLGFGCWEVPVESQWGHFSTKSIQIHCQEYWIPKIGSWTSIQVRREVTSEKNICLEDDFVLFGWHWFRGCVSLGMTVWLSTYL